VEYASTVAPAWVSDGRPTYGGGFFWMINRENDDGELVKSGFAMRGAGGQSTSIMPNHGLVVVRIGKYTGAGPGGEALNQMIPMLLEAVPPVQ
jgi:CubicO group peptidase (beta-lactamase class C family)